MQRQAPTTGNPSSSARVSGSGDRGILFDPGPQEQAPAAHDHRLRRASATGKAPVDEPAEPKIERPEAPSGMNASNSAAAKVFFRSCDPAIGLSKCDNSLFRSIRSRSRRAWCALWDIQPGMGRQHRKNKSQQHTIKISHRRSPRSSIRPGMHHRQQPGGAAAEPSNTPAVRRRRRRRQLIEVNLHRRNDDKVLAEQLLVLATTLMRSVMRSSTTVTFPRPRSSIHHLQRPGGAAAEPSNTPAVRRRRRLIVNRTALTTNAADDADEVRDAIVNDRFKAKIVDPSSARSSGAVEYPAAAAAAAAAAALIDGNAGDAPTTSVIQDADAVRDAVVNDDGVAANAAAGEAHHADADANADVDAAAAAGGNWNEHLEAYLGSFIDLEDPVKREALRLYSLHQETGVMNDAFLAACVAVAGDQVHRPKTNDAIAHAFRITKAALLIERRLVPPAAQPSTEDFIRQFSRELGLGPDSIGGCMRVFSEIDKLNTSHLTSTLAAVVLLLAEESTLKEVMRVSHVPEQTIVSAFYKLRRKLQG